MTYAPLSAKAPNKIPVSGVLDESSFGVNVKIKRTIILNSQINAVLKNPFPT